MKAVILCLFFVSSTSWASCPDLNGKFVCSYGPLILPVEIEAQPVGKGDFQYQVNGKSVLVNNKEQLLTELSAHRGVDFQNISYTGACQSGVMELKVKGSNSEGGLEGNVVLRFTNGGRFSMLVNASWEQRTRKFSILCTPTK